MIEDNTEVIVIGAGAAGLMCAIEAAKRGRQVYVIEKSHKVAEKIRISGGGRCNFTNLNTHPGCYLSHNPHFCKSALARYTPWHFIEFISAHGLSWHLPALPVPYCFLPLFLLPSFLLLLLLPLPSSLFFLSLA